VRLWNIVLCVIARIVWSGRPPSLANVYGVTAIAQHSGTLGLRSCYIALN
jgi:hypothetical protein